MAGADQVREATWVIFTSPRLLRGATARADS
jgi:hypothetical protein